MDIATIIGWLLSIGMVGALIWQQDQMTMFFGTDTAIISIVFVFGGTLAGTMMRYSMGHFISSPGSCCENFRQRRPKPTTID